MPAGGNHLKLSAYMKLKGKSKRKRKKKDSAWDYFDLGPTDGRVRYDREIIKRRPDGRSPRRDAELDLF